jgi:hypothetical protein
VCHPVSQTTQKLRRALLHPWTHLMSLKKRYLLNPLHNSYCKLWHGIGCFSCKECLFLSVSLYKSVKIRVKRYQKQSRIWGPITYRFKSSKQIGLFIWPFRYSIHTAKGTEDLWPVI